MKTASGVRYYGKRYYDPRLGRFINRDPKEEAGGLNLYRSCRNNCVNRWDVLGAYDSGNYVIDEEYIPSAEEQLQNELNEKFGVDQPNGDRHYDEFGQEWEWRDHSTANGSSGNWYRVDDPFSVSGNEFSSVSTEDPEYSLAPNSGDLFSVNGRSAGNATGFTQKDYNDALALLKATKPQYYEAVIAKLKLSTYSGATDDTAKYSGYSNVKAGAVSINLDSTVAAREFSGTAAQFLAVVILHESTHVAYYQGGFRNGPGATPAMEEASIRYWVEDWAISNGIPQTVPNGRSGTGFLGNKAPFTPSFSNIYDGVVNDGYSTDPFPRR